VKALTVPEAAQFLRMSKSSVYQRKDIPRYRRPGSRVILFDQDELEAWLKSEPVAPQTPLASVRKRVSTEQESPLVDVIDIAQRSPYHRNLKYRGAEGGHHADSN
jgi:excisionase family DNA binding protein